MRQRTVLLSLLPLPACGGGAAEAAAMMACTTTTLSTSRSTTRAPSGNGVPARPTYVDKGIPIILGEFGAISRLSKDPAGTRRNHHSMGLFNRKTTLQASPQTIKAIVNAAK